jgi:hypothetical protein
MRLVFVYNANAGLVAGLLDSVHKIASPATYPCSLCAVTYGPVAMRRRWRDYLSKLPIHVDFYHRPDFRAAFPAAADWPLPLVAIDRAGSLKLLLGADDLDAMADVGALITALEARLPA